VLMEAFGKRRPYANWYPLIYISMQRLDATNWSKNVYHPGNFRPRGRKRKTYFRCKHLAGKI